MSGKRDLKLTIESSPTKSLDVGAVTASANGASSNLTHYEGAHMLVDADAYTDGTHTIKLQDSPDNSVWTDVPAANLLWDTNDSAIVNGQIVIDDAADDDAARIVHYSGFEQYIRVVTVVSGATTGAIYGATITRSHKRNLGKLNS